MTEKELIGKLRELGQIRPSKNWVFLTKRQILGEKPVLRERISWLEVFPRIIFQYKIAFASLVIIGIFIGTFGFAQNSLPGDFLYSLKKISEKARAVFVSATERPKAQLQLVNKRLEELTEIVETNQVKKLASAIEEYQESISEAVKATSEIEKVKEVRKIVPEIKKIEENIENLKIYGVVIDEKEEPAQLYRPIVEPLIEDLEDRTLSPGQKVLFEQIKEDFQAGDYSVALEKILLLSNSSGEQF